MTLPPLGLYVHLPWCERKCPYCDFNSHEAVQLPEAAYVDALLDDLRRESAGEARPIETIFVGGGTPSLFSVDAIARLLHGIRHDAPVASDAEITLEANPGSSDSAKLAAFVAAGVTRFSVGVQSFNAEALQRLGRIHDAADAVQAVEAAAASGAQSFNLDLMHGLPGQTSADGLADIDRAIELTPPHISWYQLTIEPNTRFYSDPPVLPGEDTLQALEEAGSRRLEAAGYERYEVSAWARPGDACRHNLNYWRFGDYLAIGAGAHGKLTRGDGTIERYAKTRLPADYLAAGGTGRRAVRALDAASRRGEFLLNALRLRAGFTMDLFESRTGLPAAALQPELDMLLEQGLLEQRGDAIRCTDTGWRFLDDVVGRFFP